MRHSLCYILPDERRHLEQEMFIIPALLELERSTGGRKLVSKVTSRYRDDILYPNREMVTMIWETK